MGALEQTRLYVFQASLNGSVRRGATSGTAGSSSTHGGTAGWKTLPTRKKRASTILVRSASSQRAALHMAVTTWRVRFGNGAPPCGARKWRHQAFDILIEMMMVEKTLTLLHPSGGSCEEDAFPADSSKRAARIAAVWSRMASGAATAFALSSAPRATRGPNPPATMLRDERKVASTGRLLYFHPVVIADTREPRRDHLLHYADESAVPRFVQGAQACVNGSYPSRAVEWHNSRCPAPDLAQVYCS